MYEISAKALIFDVDGTIVKNIPWHLEAWHAFTRKYGNEFTDEQIVSNTGATNEFYMGLMLGRKPAPDELQALAEEKEAMYRELYAPHMAPAPGLMDFLDAARERGIPCGIASGAPRVNIDFVIDGLGIRDRFAAIVDDTCYKHGKPAPDCFLEAARRLGVAPTDCLVLEDAVSGIRGAHAADMRAATLVSSNPRETLLAAGADWVVDTFTELHLA